MKTLQSYKNDPKLKSAFLKEIEKHRKADQIIQGTYEESNGSKFRGCAVGCSIHSLNILLNKHYSVSDHLVYEEALGLPEWLAYLEDTIFEGLPLEEAKKWPGRFAKAIPEGVDLEHVKWSFSAFLLKENIERVLSLKDLSDEFKTQVVSAIRGVLTVTENAIQTGVWDEAAARSVARSAEYVADAAWSAAWSAEAAAWSAEAAARSVASVAWSAARVAWSAARSAAYQRYAKELLRLLKQSSLQKKV